MTYLLQVNIGLLLFYTLYQLVCKQDTHFAWRRGVLLLSIVLSFLIPAIDLKLWMENSYPIASISQYYATLALPQIIVHTGDATHGNLWQQLDFLLPPLYLTGVTILAARLIVQLKSICLMIRRSPSKICQGIVVKQLDSHSGPFSFFKWIFVNLHSTDEKELEDILIHENAHAQQLHSADVILAEVMCIACWMNPFAWLMKKEIKQNLEFLADQKVINAGFDMKRYQYHLLAMTCNKPQQTLFNSFNLSNLKKRIIMMKKEKNNRKGHIKYAFFTIPALALLIAGNSSCSSKKAEQEEKKIQTETTAPEKKTEQVPTATPALDQEVFAVVEQMPEYPGGLPELMKFLNKNIKYPPQAKENNIQGKVIIQFVINKDGTPCEFSVIRSVSPELDEEALRVLKQMPKWKPGMQKGQKVRVKFTVPVSFKLS